MAEEHIGEILNTVDAVAVGGGNSFLLLRDLYRTGLIKAIAHRVKDGLPYFGWSAGSNVACPTIMTTNDMPICDPGGFDALGLVPFQINPHYLHGNPPGFKGETREARITEFCAMNPGLWVAGLRECTGLRLEDGQLSLRGDGGDCRLFRHGREPFELAPGSNVQFLMDD